ncbi:hypothetical protein E2C01_007883 [Portunus trituberculatus]|uniref:Uncharacterized protein n=1 Tax=Portunus trituberculatus TaxID=210409 RepID=A0A5B7D1L9_PORTR|nr:hypothetical protein [Portunus trituberculatus]
MRKIHEEEEKRKAEGEMYIPGGADLDWDLKKKLLREDYLMDNQEDPKGSTRAVNMLEAEIDIRANPLHGLNIKATSHHRLLDPRWTGEACNLNTHQRRRLVIGPAMVEDR